MTINDQTLQDRIHWHPHSKQQIILDGSKGKRNVSVCAGIKFGKSQLCGYIATKYILSDNQRIWIVSLSYDMAGRVFRHMVDFLGQYNKSLMRYVSFRPPQRMEIPEFNSFVECKSIENPHSLLGEELDLCIFDEASRFPPEIYERYIMARLASRQGKLFCISTPFGQNWFYRNHLMADASFHFTSKDNPYFPIEEWGAAKKKLPHAIFQQEYEATFLPDAASVFRGVDEILGDTAEDALAGHFYVMGVDLGKHEDFTTISILDMETREEVYKDRFNKIEYPFQKSRILATSERYNHARVYLDSTVVGEPIKEDLERMRCFVDDFKFSNKSKKELIEKLSISIEQGYIKLQNDPLWTNELKSFGYQLTEHGNVIYSAPQGLHDDTVYARALAVWGLPPGKPLRADPIARELAKTKRIIKRSYI